MKFTAEDLKVLDNVSNINQSIVFRPGSVLYVGTPNLSVFCRAKLDVVIDRGFAVFNVKKLLGVLSLFDEPPEIEIDDGKLRLRSGKQSLDYVLGDETLMKPPPNKDPSVPAPVAEFPLKWSDLNTALKAVSLLNLPTVALTCDGTTIKVVARDSSNSSKDKYSVEVGESTAAFDVPLSRTSMKFMSADYVVGAHASYASFSSDRITYWLPKQIES